MITVLTSSINREIYLNRLINSMNNEDISIEHIIYTQEKKLSEANKYVISCRNKNHKTIIKHSDKKQSIGNILNECTKIASYPIFLKIDDDCKLLSDDFFTKMIEISNLVPDSIVYPLIIGGYSQNTFTSKNRKVIYSKNLNEYFTINQPNEMNGIYFCPTSLIKQFIFPSAQFDAEYLWGTNLGFKIPLWQVENGLVVEHQEGIWGQHYRNAQNE